MSDAGHLVAALAIAAAVLLWCLLVLLFPRYVYEVRDGLLVIRRLILRRLPFGTTEIPLDKVRAVERREFGLVQWHAWRAALRGSPWAPRGLTLVVEGLQRPRRVYITPPDQDRFLRRLVELTGVEVRGPSGEAPGVLHRLPVWLSDLLALTSAALGGTAVAFPESLARSPAGSAATIVGCALVLFWVMLMLYDSLRLRPTLRSPWLAAWPFLIVLVFPSAWLYYLLHGRRRQQPSAERPGLRPRD